MILKDFFGKNGDVVLPQVRENVHDWTPLLLTPVQELMTGWCHMEVQSWCTMQQDLPVDVGRRTTWLIV